MEDIIGALKEESKARRIRTRNLRLAFGILLLISIVSAALTTMRGRPFDWITILPLVVLATGISMGVNGRHKILSAAAAKLNDKRAIGSLIEVLDSGDKDLAETAESALIPLMKTVTPKDQLDDYQLDKLASALSRTKSRAFFSAGVDLLARNGTQRSLHSLDALVAVPPNGLNSHAAENIAREGAANLRMRLARLQIDGTEADSIQRVSTT